MVSAHPKISGPRPCACTDAALAAAEIVGVKAEHVACEKFSFTTGDGQEFDDVATAMRYFARLRPDLCLYGRGFSEAVSVDYWMGKICERFLVPLLAAADWSAAGGDCTKIFEDVGSRLKCIDEHLVSNTFLACERMTIADVLLAVIVARFDARCSGCSEKYVNVKRWAATVHNHPAVKKFVGGACATGGKQQGQKQQQQQGGKQQQQKAEQPAGKKELTGEDLEAAIAAEEKAKAKKVNPLDQLPPTNFVLDAWKREYSNSKDLMGKTMPWFWENFDKEGWSLWYMKYNKLEGENTVGYATSNMLGGFLQRLDNAFRKYSFAVINIVGETGGFDIQGVWLIRGQEIPFELKDHPSFEYHTFRKLDAVADKALIEEYWTADDKVEGRPIDSCKVWK